MAYVYTAVCLYVCYYINTYMYYTYKTNSLRHLGCFFFFGIINNYLSLIWAAITNYLAGLNSRHLFLTVLEAGKSKIKVLAELVSSEGPLPGLQTAVPSLYPHMAEKEHAHSLTSS